MPLSGSTMTVEAYAQIDRAERIFDGRRARDHLERNPMSNIPANLMPASVYVGANNG